MAYFDVNKIKIKFKIKYPRFEYILERLPVVFDDKINTACTDGEKLFFNKFFMNGLDEDEQLFVFAHEVLHVALNHIDRCLDKDIYYWNLATDAVINDYLRNNGLKMIDNCVDVAGALNHTAEEMYEKMKKEDEEKENKEEDSNIKDSDKVGNGKPMESNSKGNNQDKNNNENGNSSKGNETEKEKEKKSRGNVGHDDHSMWQDAAKKHQENNSNNPNDVNENDEFKNNDAEKRRRDDDYLKNGVNDKNRNAKGYGNAPGMGREKVGISESEEALNWRDLLTINARANADWNIADGEVEYGVVNPIFEQEESVNCEIVIDSSGSIDNNLIRAFLEECLAIMNTSSVKVGFFDTEFYGFNEIRDEDDINELNIAGGGGTNFEAAVNAFSDSCENKIIFTDGDAPMPKDDKGALWIVFGYVKHEIYPNSGKVIYITGKDYEDLLQKKLNKRSK